MVPKVAKGGASFIAAGGYYLGEGRLSVGQTSAVDAAIVGGIAGYVLGDGHGSGGTARPYASRVGFTMARNLPTQDARLGFMLMQGRYQIYLEERTGKRGRPLDEPVYSYSLSWAPGETPDRPEMELAAETSLTVLGMEAHQALIVEHRDKAYAHIHVIVNRVHPTAQRAAHTSMDQYKLSRWAEAFENERGQIWCERRVENNALRDTGAAVKDTVSRSRSDVEAERAGAASEIAAWRTEQDALRGAEHREGAEALWRRQQAERQALETQTRATIAHVRQAISDRYKPDWRARYKAEREHLHHIKTYRRGILERAVHAFVHSRTLGFGERLSAAEIAAFALSKKALLDRVMAVYRRERSALSERQLNEVKASAKAVWSRHHQDLKPMKVRHKTEREALRREQRSDQSRLQTIRKAALDQALVKSDMAEVKSMPAVLKPEHPAFSIERLVGVWAAFRDRLSPQNQAAQTTVYEAPKTLLMHQLPVTTSASGSGERSRGHEQEM